MNGNTNWSGAGRKSTQSYLLMAVIATAVGVIDLRIVPYLQSAGMSPSAIVDVATVLLSGLFGLRLALNNGQPAWWRTRDEPRGPGRLLLLAGLGGLVIVSTTAPYFLSPLSSLPAWARSLTPEMALLLALRAALQEEVLFRFFMVGLGIWIARRIGAVRRVALVGGTLLSALAFTFIHAGFWLPFIEGLLLAAIYFAGGLVPAIAVHFLADAIPFLILAMR